MEEDYYSENNILDKKEFIESSKKGHIYNDPMQLVLRNLISKNTIYDSILLYWQTGVGKTAAAISIAEGFKEYVSNMGRKVLVLVKNGNIEKNFRNEILSEITRGEYNIDEDEFEGNNMNKLNRKINKVYNFMTYGTFVNKVLGAKDFIKDDFGKNIKGNERKQSSNAITNFNNTVIIIDEAHNVTNNDVYMALIKVLKNSYNYRLVLLTATPMYDNSKEIMEISNLLNVNNKLLPIRNDLFKSENPIMNKTQSDFLTSRILKNGVTSITEYGKKLLLESMKGKVSFLEVNTDSFPERIDKGESLLKDRIGTLKVVYCEMSDYQYNVYDMALKLDSNENGEMNDDGENGEINGNEGDNIKRSSLYKNSSDASTMVYPKNLYGKDGFNECFIENEKGLVLKPKYKHVFTKELEKYSCKLYKVLENVKNSKGNVFIYSNYVNQGGISLIKQMLLANDYVEYPKRSNNGNTFILYDDSMSVELRESLRNVFNNVNNKNGEYAKIIIGSPIISEGITLKNVRQVHILEPTWNMSRINQIIGRAIRHYSHDMLPIEDRNVEIYKYCAIKNDSIYRVIKDDGAIKSNRIYFIDKEKYILIEEKDRANKIVERVLKESAFDCAYNKNKNKKSIHENGLAECDYMNCEYECVIKQKDNKIDTFMYNLFIKFYEEYDIEFCVGFIKGLFKEYYIWDLNSIKSHIKEKEPMVSDESIYMSLKQLLDYKIILNDKYNREGYLIEKGDVFIFNPLNMDINSSIYSKTLDFSVNSNKYTLRSYLDEKNITKQKDVKENEIEEEIEEIEEIEEEIEEYNNNIMSKYLVYGTYRARPIKGELFGKLDYDKDGKLKLKIVDKRNMIEDSTDNRSNISGMAATSYKIDKLKEIINYLKIDIPQNISKQVIIENIERFMEKNGMILK